jgi:hypothetical protein
MELDNMLKQPTGERNLSPQGLTNERLYINMLNDVLGDIVLTPAEEGVLIWLCRYDTSTVENIVSVIEKVKAAKS